MWSILRGSISPHRCPFNFPWLPGFQNRVIAPDGRSGRRQTRTAVPGTQQNGLLCSDAEADTHSSLWVPKLGPQAAPTTPLGIRRGLRPSLACRQQAQ